MSLHTTRQARTWTDASAATHDSIEAALNAAMKRVCGRTINPVPPRQTPEQNMAARKERGLVGRYDAEILRLSNEGKTQREIADALGTSTAHIHQRAKTLDLKLVVTRKRCA